MCYFSKRARLKFGKHQDINLVYECWLTEFYLLHEFVLGQIILDIFALLPNFFYEIRNEAECWQLVQWLDRNNTFFFLPVVSQTYGTWNRCGRALWSNSFIFPYSDHSPSTFTVQIDQSTHISLIETSHKPPLNEILKANGIANRSPNEDDLQTNGRTWSLRVNFNLI